MNQTTNDKLPHLIIYHGGCPDGIGGAWAFWRTQTESSETKFHPGQHGEAPPNVKNQDVILVDFSYPLPIMRKLVSDAKSVLVLDHHKTSESLKSITDPKFTMILDMQRSGAQIGWDFVNPGLIRPWFIDHIADRDLWKWSIPESNSTTRAMFSAGYYKTIEQFDLLKDITVNSMLKLGDSLLQDDERSYTSIIKHAIDCICISPIDSSKKWRCRVVECHSSQSSVIGNRLVKDNLIDFSVMFSYALHRDEWFISLRANSNSDIDLTEIVQHFGNGGGHTKAAGFTIKGSENRSLKTLFKPVSLNERFHIIDKKNKTSTTLSTT